MLVSIPNSVDAESAFPQQECIRRHGSRQIEVESLAYLHLDKNIPGLADNACLDNARIEI